MRRTVLLPLLLLLLGSPAAAQDIELPPGGELEVRVDGDLNGDGTNDIAYVAHNEDGRALTVLLSVEHEVDFEFKSEVLLLDLTEFTPASLSIERGVLVFEDLTGGTTATAATRRFRYDARGKRMRLIGMDATVYSRTNAHDGFEASWNLLNGDVVTRELRLAEGAGEDAYEDGPTRRFKRRSGPVWLAGSPEAETMLEAMRPD
jgi:hypothetical protein